MKKAIGSLDVWGPALTTGIFLLLAFWVISNGHIHEDAYILYIFSEQWAENGIISYFDYGPPIEGATDFLWMALISLLNRVGINSAIAAIFLNATGIAIITVIILRLIKTHGGGAVTKLVFISIIPLYSFSQASLAGFSTALYCALSLVIFIALYNWSSSKLIFVPLIGVFIGLFRPDGVVIGVAATIVGALLVERDYRRKYLLISLIAATIGLIYFALRWNYFGEILPLPLYVKSQSSDFLPGLGKNLRWMAFNCILILTSITALLFFSKERSRILLAALPTTSLFFALIFVSQTQNVALRFQAPLSITLLAICAMVASNFENNSEKTKSLRAGFVIFSILFVTSHLFFHAAKNVSLLKYLGNSDYINFFPYLARGAFTEQTVTALTEAGRLAYWVKGEKYDLVGLCTAETAINGASNSFIQSIEPDVIFLHTGKKTALHDCAGKNFCEVSNSKFREIIRNSDINDYENIQNRVKRAPLAAFDYLRTTPSSYRIFFVKYKGSFKHFYAVREDGNIDIPAFLTALQKSFRPENRISYLSMIRSSHET